LARVTNYGELLERQPPTHEAEIIEASSWSCAHGVERWRSDCGCRTGSPPDWTQAWRKPLRQALDWLRDEAAAPFEALGARLFEDPFAARDAYIAVVLDRTEASIDAFLDAYARPGLSAEEKTQALELMELGRNAMLMYTSCGWFFDDLSNIETIQILQYAGRVVELGETLFGESLEGPFLERLEKARSNVAEMGDGRRIWDKFVAKARVDLLAVTAHWAASTVLEPDRAPNTYCYDVAADPMETHENDGKRLLIGRVTVTSRLTRASERYAFAVLRLGEHRVAGGVRRDPGDAAHGEQCKAVVAAFEASDFEGTMRMLFRHCDRSIDSIDAVFRDDQRKLVERLLQPTLAEVEAVQRSLFERCAPLLRRLAPLKSPTPRTLLVAGELVLGADLLRAAERVPPDAAAMRRLLAQAKEQDVRVDRAALSFALGRSIERLAQRLQEQPNDPALYAELDTIVDFARSAGFPVDLWRTQNVFYRLVHTVYPEAHVRADDGDASAYAVCMAFQSLAERLRVRLPDESSLTRVWSMRGEDLEELG
jgi:hypothetical protein